MSKDKTPQTHFRKRTPLWKWLIIILLVIAMPLFFSYYRMANLRFVIKNAMPIAPVSKP